MAYGYGRKYGSTARRYNRRASARGRGLYTGNRYGGSGDYAAVKRGFSSARRAARGVAQGFARNSAVRAAGNDLLKAVGAHALRGGGSAIGSLVGGDSGRMMGHAAGAALSKTLGFGSYQPPGSTKMVANELIAGGHASEGIMRFDAQRDHETLVLSHSEYVMDVYAPPTGERNADIMLPLNPGLATSFPMLSQIAANFETYRLKQCIITYKPMLSSWLTEKGQVGQVIIATQYNTHKTKWTTKEQMLAQTGSTSARVIESTAHGVECDVKKLPTDGKFFVRTGMPEGGATQMHEYDHAFTQIRVQDVPTDGSASAANMTLGEIHISYTVELAKPRMWSGIGRSIPRFLQIDGRSPTSQFAASHADFLYGVNLTGKSGRVHNLPGAVCGMETPSVAEFSKHQLIAQKSSIECTFRPESGPMDLTARTLLADNVNVGELMALQAHPFPTNVSATAGATVFTADNNVDFFALTLPAQYAADLEIDLSIPFISHQNFFSRCWIGYQCQGNIDPIVDILAERQRQFIGSGFEDGGAVPAEGGIFDMSIVDSTSAVGSTPASSAPHFFSGPHFSASEHSMAFGEQGTLSGTVYPAHNNTVALDANGAQIQAPLLPVMMWAKVKLHVRTQRASAGVDNKVMFKLFRVSGNGQANYADTAYNSRVQYGRISIDVHQYNSGLNRRDDGGDDRPVLENSLNQVQDLS